MMFNEVAFLGRFGAAAEAGFQGVEFPFPTGTGKTLERELPETLWSGKDPRIQG